MIPDVIQGLIALVVLYLVINGLKGLSELIGKDLSGWSTVIAGLITATILFFLSGLIKLLPADVQAIVAALLQVIVLLLGAMGVKRVEVKAREA